MSKSRLEKFLYALYSLDSSDLPNPLSRIEELYKCLVTSEEAPSFEPISRVEKYLMAILGAYDVDSLPKPLSRVEVLLYKLATGDDNLDGFDTFLSQHEELLAEIIRNGGVGGNIDIEYVLYTLSTEFNTLYNTAEKPVKSAILKGSTLVNSWKKHNTYLPSNFTFHDDGFMELNNPELYFDHVQTDSSLLKPNTKYLLIVEAKNNTLPVETSFYPDSRSVFSNSNKQVLFNPKTNGVSRIILTSNSDFSTTTDDKRWGVYISFSQANTPENERGTLSIRQMLLEYQYGMENWDIPYFEGMQSVKMPVLTTSNEDGTKTNILSTSEDVELRGIGVVQDTLNCLTGEVTERIGTGELNGTESWTWKGFNTDISFVVKMSSPIKNIKSGSKLLLDKFNYGVGSSFSTITFREMDGTIGVYLPKNTIDDWENDWEKKLPEFLSKNNINFKYELASESVKTVDLSVVDQDGDNTKLSTFNDITHVTLSSEGLIPEAELEVATKNEEDLEDSSVYTTHTLSEEFNTLYNTAEKPVKSAILKGQTLVNLSKRKTITITSTTSDYVWSNYPLKLDSNLFEAGKKYLYSSKYSYTNDAFNNKNSIYFIIKKKDETTERTFFQTTEKGIFTIPTNFETTDTLSMRFHASLGTAIDNTVTCDDIKILEYQEGMENWDIPYFEGMQSVKMPVLTTVGKNLLDPSSVELVVENDNSAQTVTYDSVTDTYEFLCPKSFNQMNIILKNSYKVTSPEQVYVAGTYESEGNVYNIGKRFALNVDKFSIDIIHEWRPVIKANLKIIITSDKSATTTSYEPYKSNILTVNEEVELRGIGDVQDTLDCLTGELVQKTEKIIFDGSEAWEVISSLEKDNTIFAQCYKYTRNNTNAISNILDYRSSLDALDERGFRFNHFFQIRLNKNEISNITNNGVKEWVSKNNIIVVRVEEQTVKTVDLSVVDQDGDNTKLSTFNDITHVTLSSEGLIPEAELEVAEKVPEVAASMLTISREQEEINATTNEQSENVDATMIATTEIYEDLL